MSSAAFAKFQKLGRALMLPIAVLPVAGLLLRLGQPDLLNIKWLADAGGAVFTNLPLIFAIGVAVGFAKENHGAAGLAGGIGYLILTAVLKSINDKLDMGVLAGILSGIVAGNLYNRYKDIKMPEYLAFFGGKRFVPIITGLVCVLLGLLCGYIWPVIQQGIDWVGHALINAGGLGLFIYGLLNRLLLVTGLHHILNSLVWFVFGSYPGPEGKAVTGDLHRFFAGDPTAGSFMTGFFPIMMFGLPAACLAMYHAARPENRKLVGGMLLSMALTAFLTGVTEPVEFTFMFLAPILYVIHGILTGISMALMNFLGVRLGFTFSAGAFDYVISYRLGTNGWMLIPVGLAYFVIYYFLFSFAIRKFNLATPGRAEASLEPTAEPGTPAPGGEAGGAAAGPLTGAVGYLRALGGNKNLKLVDACTTRLRLEIVDDALVNEPALRSLGARGVVRPSRNTLQVVIGPQAEILAGEIREAMAGGEHAPLAPPAAAAAPAAGAESSALAAPEPASAEDTAVAQRLVQALGGSANVAKAEHVAVTRLRFEVRESGRADEAALQRAGAAGVTKVSESVWHVIAGQHAPAIASALDSILETPCRKPATFQRSSALWLERTRSRGDYICHYHYVRHFQPQFEMKAFRSASLAEAGVFAIRQTLRRIIREFEDDPNTAVRQTIDAETKKKAIDVDLIADREFATQFRHYDGRRYASVVVTGEERPGEAVPVSGTVGTYVVVDALDGSDLAERSLANWCSAAVFFDVAGSSAKIRAAVVGLPPNHVYFATDDDPRVRVYRDLPDLEGQVLANLTLEPEEVTGLPPERALSDASLYFYGQKVERLLGVAQRPLLSAVCNEEFENLRIYNLGGIPMLVRMCDHQVKRARGVDAVFELDGQKPYDVVPGLFFALKLGATVLDLSRPHPTPIGVEDLEKALLGSGGVQLQYLAAAHERLADELFPLLRPAAQ